ncbi:hypothetical protein DVA67_006575 [Solirubrobacter sp. CPCC 204708]|uniref:Uncharacterized protein n=1 Tax=Solirubrobacter deserti TaxID=2282478 RepID=A0ABT4RCK4_9ACTN|nr:hypothetical protein [Solirubrobacter deserti]MBE2315633.1 hypothetical protein [Solirubrobacter deserti]MDA0136272.1 hypothetical protein [Solirubrobacter deserti]
MCANCAYTASVSAAAGATGLRVWLQTRTWSWLTPRRLRRITIVSVIAAFAGATVTF